MGRRNASRAGYLTSAQIDLIDARKKALGMVDDKELADALKMDQSNISKWRLGALGKRGGTGPSVPVLYKLAEALGVHIGKLMDPDSEITFVTATLPPIDREARSATVYPYGFAGNPVDADDLPDDAESIEVPAAILKDWPETGYGIRVKGESLAGLGIHTGMVAWIHPKPFGWVPEHLDVIAARVWNGDGDRASEGPRKIVLKQWRRANGLPAGIWSVPDPEHGEPEMCSWDNYRPMGLVVYVNHPGWKPGRE